MKIYKNNYVYEIINTMTNKRYIGTRSTNLKPQDDIGFLYFSSSSNKEFIQEQKQHPEIFEYIIKGNFTTRKEAIKLEIRLHEENNVGNNPEYYNKSKQTSTGFDTTGNEEVSKKISEFKKPKGKRWFVNEADIEIFCFLNDERLSVGN